MFCLCLDLDGTLFAKNCPKIQKNLTCRHIEEIWIKTNGYPCQYYAINRQIMAKIINSVLDRGDKIAIVTTSKYKPDAVLAILDVMFDLGIGYLKSKDFIVINREHPCSQSLDDDEKLKGDIIISAQECKIIPKDAKVVLLDDTDKQIENAKQYFNVIKATGCPLDGSEMNNDYIYDLIKILELPPSLVSFHDPCQSMMKRYRIYG